MYSIRSSCVTFLRPGFQAVDKQCMTALHLAATHDHKEICHLLIMKGAQLRCIDDDAQTPLHMAATEGNIEVIKMLFEEAERRDTWVTIQHVSEAYGYLINGHVVEQRNLDVDVCFVDAD